MVEIPYEGGDSAAREVVDGAPGILITRGGRPLTVIVFTVTGGTITAIRTLTDPPRLAQVVPSWVA